MGSPYSLTTRPVPSSPSMPPAQIINGAEIECEGLKMSMRYKVFDSPFAVEVFSLVESCSSHDL